MGTVFNIQRFSIHDGPGIRTTVFLKGCPLRCLWCHNPESNRAVPELMYYRNLCTVCGACEHICPENAVLIRDGVVSTDRSRCTLCGRCIQVCHSKAREIMGHAEKAEDVAAEVMKDEKFYRHSGGGVTISGGEPLAQPEFTADILRLCKEQGLNTCIETCGYASRESFDKGVQYADRLLYDIKHMDDTLHKKYTGVSNRKILDNLRHAAQDLHKIVWIRMPLIANVNDSESEIRAAIEYVSEFREWIEKVYLLPYHTLGISKLEALNRPVGQCDGFAAPAEEHLKKLADLWAAAGYEVHIG